MAVTEAATLSRQQRRHQERRATEKDHRGIGQRQGLERRKKQEGGKKTNGDPHQVAPRPSCPQRRQSAEPGQQCDHAQNDDPAAKGEDLHHPVISPDQPLGNAVHGREEADANQNEGDAGQVVLLGIVHLRFVTRQWSPMAAWSLMSGTAN